MNHLLDKIRRLLLEAVQISYQLFKIMVPVILIVKAMTELGIVEVLGRVLSPVMELAGLPGSSGLVWATAMVTNLYGGVIVLISLAAQDPLTAAQTTVLTSMMLIAHGLPVELRITQKAGIRLYVMGALRVGGAFLFGLIFNRIYLLGNWLQEPNIIAWAPPVQNPSIIAWAISQVRSLAMIFLVILCLLAVLRILGRLGVTRLITRGLEPLLRLLGIGEAAASVTIVGMTLGIAYGGGLILQEAHSGRLKKTDVLFSLSLMGLCHSIFEDTILMALVGGGLSGILLGRVAFSLLAIYLMVKWISRFSETTLNRYVFIKSASAKAAAAES